MTTEKQQVSDELDKMQEGLDLLFKEATVTQQLALQSKEDKSKTLSTAQYQMLQELGLTSVGNVEQFEKDSATLRKVGVTMETIQILKKIKDQFGKNIISYNNMCLLCQKYNLYFGPSSLFTGTMPMENILEMEKFPFGTFASHFTPLDIRPNVSIVSLNVASRCNTMVVAPLNLFKLEDTFIAQSRELIKYQGVKSKCVFPVASDPIVVLPFKVNAINEVFFLIITHWGNSKSII